MIDIMVAVYVGLGVLAGQFIDKVLHQGVVKKSEYSDLEVRVYNLEEKFKSHVGREYREGKTNNSMIDTVIEKVLDYGISKVLNRKGGQQQLDGN
jgi:hypothetical protein